MQKLKEEKVEKEQKNKIMQKIKEEKGITLLALILTVVIMIILAAVTINVALGEGGLVDQAKWAAEQTANVAKSEQEQLDDVADQINDIVAGIGTGDTNSTGGEETNSVDTNSVDTNSVEETNTIEPEPEPIPDGTITIGEAQWQEDGTANVSITSSESKYIIQYQINGTEEKSWKAVQNGVVTGVNHGDTVYARLTDGEQYSNPQNKKIEDTTAPEKANIEVTPESVIIGENITAKVTHVDNETGVDIGKSGWLMNTSASAIGTDDTSAYTRKFTTNPETITLDSSAEGTYYLHVLTIDKAGNKTETVSNAITISRITGTVTQEGEITWSGGTATLKLATTESQYKIVYKVNEEGSWQEYNGTSITGLNHGDKVKACLTNEGQTTYGPELNITIEDATAPVVTVTAQGSPTTNSVTVTAQAVDNETGMKDSLTYTYYIKKSAEGDESYKTPSGAENITNAQYTFTGLTQGTNYDIKVEVNGDKAGNIGTGTLTNQTTATVPGADAGLVTGAITASPAVWNEGKASITLTTTTGFQIEYQVGGITGSWTKGNSPIIVGNLAHGDTVYARLTDGINAGNSASITVLDNTAPTVSIGTGAITENSIEVKVTASSDGESGLADTNTYKYYINNSLKSTTSNKSYTFSSLSAGTSYTIKVEAYDKAGNVGTATASAKTNEAGLPESTSYVGYYADVDGNGTVDGVIYVDLATDGGKSGEWEVIGGEYTIPKVSDFKKYKVSKTGHSDDFGTKDVLTVANSSGNERFYVMALDDIDGKQNGTRYCWYSAAYDVGGMTDWESTTSTSFGSGKQNTKNMIAKWNSSAYGGQNWDSSSPDMWGLSAVQSKINANPAWYVPSREEWSAFGDKLDNRSDYASKGLSYEYWISSQHGIDRAWCIDFESGMAAGVKVNGGLYVRLGTTF